MTSRNLFIALVSAVAGGLIVAVAMSDWVPLSTAKSERLGGPSTETAFMPERFGVPTSTPIVK